LVKPTEVDIMEISAAESLFSLTDRELWLVTSHAGSRRGGLIATFVCHASLVPELPRVLVAIAKQHQTWELIDHSQRFALHLIGEEQLELVWRFALQSGRQVDKFADLAFDIGKSGNPRLESTLGWLDCRVETQLETGDRTVYLAEVVEARALRAGKPLTMRRLLELAPAEKREQLKLLRQRDAAIDAASIRAWRALTLGSGF
jgi:flavin reductase (DIM6/NTAB) family NADH-FMN oxidoreductase RutF